MTFAQYLAFNFVNALIIDVYGAVEVHGHSKYNTDKECPGYDLSNPFWATHFVDLYVTDPLNLEKEDT
jgi:hypothetical protein